MELYPDKTSLAGRSAQHDGNVANPDERHALIPRFVRSPPALLISEFSKLTTSFEHPLGAAMLSNPRPKQPSLPSKTQMDRMYGFSSTRGWRKERFIPN